MTWSQAGFIRGRSCANNLWILRRVAERAVEFNTPVYCALIDYKGAFDAINRTSLGRVLTLFLSPSMVRRVLSLYFDAKAKVVVNNSVGPEFDLLRGVQPPQVFPLLRLRLSAVHSVLRSKVLSWCIFTCHHWNMLTTKSFSP